MAVAVGTLSLDLEIRQQALKRYYATGKITEDELAEKTDEIMSEWQTSYDETEKGQWTNKMIPSVRVRCSILLVLDHYTVQFLTGHGDFRAKLHHFKLVDDPICACDRNHALIHCPRTRQARERLKDVFRGEGVP